MMVSANVHSKSDAHDHGSYYGTDNVSAEANCSIIQDLVDANIRVMGILVPMVLNALSPSLAQASSLWMKSKPFLQSGHIEVISKATREGR